MAAVPQGTLNWLYNVLNQLDYRDPNRTYSDLVQTLTQSPGFAPRSTDYTSDNGALALLVCLEGTIPVNYRGTVYRFPLTIWMPTAYPREGPMVYVTPAENMVVRQGQHVSAADGKIYHHYLAGWAQAWDKSNIVEFLKILTDIFAREPPVGARPPRGAPLPPARPTQGQPSSSAPQPQSRQGSQSFPGQGPRPPPPPPPKQSTTGAGSSRPSSAAPPPLPPPPAPKPGRYDAPPPLPPQQSQSPRPQSMYVNGNAQQPPGGMQYMPQRQSYHPDMRSQQPSPSQHHRIQPPPGPGVSLGPPHAQQSPPPQQSQQRQQPSDPSRHQQHNYPAQQNVQVTGQQPSIQTHPQSYVQTQAAPQQPGPPQPKSSQRDLLSEEDPFQLTLPTTSSSQIPVPAIPPNPEKAALLSHLSHQILQHLHQSVNQNTTTAIPLLQSQHTALSAAHQQLSQEIAQLQTLSSHLNSNITALTSTISQANNTITSTKNPNHPTNASNIPSIDEVIIPPTVIARQLYDNVSEQRGYEAAIYALNEAFVKGRVGADIWSRKVRECAREEFRRKWMVQRIGEGLGLDGRQRYA